MSNNYRVSDVTAQLFPGRVRGRLSGRCCRELATSGPFFLGQGSCDCLTPPAAWGHSCTVPPWEENEEICLTEKFSARLATHLSIFQSYVKSSRFPEQSVWTISVTEKCPFPSHLSSFQAAKLMWKKSIICTLPPNLLVMSFCRVIIDESKDEDSGCSVSAFSSSHTLPDLHFSRQSFSSSWFGVSVLGFFVIQFMHS